jgi:RNA polymerase sigma-70 factor, ECF subfamily
MQGGATLRLAAIRPLLAATVKRFGGEAGLRSPGLVARIGRGGDVSGSSARFQQYGAAARSQPRLFLRMTIHDSDDHAALVAAWQAQAAALPDVAVPFERFAAFVTARRPSGSSLAEMLASSSVGDLYLACACIAGDPAAVAAFDAELAAVVGKAVGSFGSQAAEEVWQALRSALIVDHRGRGPLLQEYRGQGALTRWLRVVAVREATRLYHVGKREGPSDDDALFDSLIASGQVDAELVRLDAAQQFRRAFAAALADLPTRERTALRMHVVDGLSIDQIAPAFAVHRATVARWISTARDLLLANTREHLMRELRLGATDADSLIRAAGSRVDLSLERLLRRDEQG